MIEDIHEKLRTIDQHLENIKNIIPGMPDSLAILLLGHIDNAEYNLRTAHSYLSTEREAAEWET